MYIIHWIKLLTLPVCLFSQCWHSMARGVVCYQFILFTNWCRNA